MRVSLTIAFVAALATSAIAEKKIREPWDTEEDIVLRNLILMDNTAPTVATADVDTDNQKRSEVFAAIEQFLSKLAPKHAETPEVDQLNHALASIIANGEATDSESAATTANFSTTASTAKFARFTANAATAKIARRGLTSSSAILSKRDPHLIHKHDILLEEEQLQTYQADPVSFIREVEIGTHILRNAVHVVSKRHPELRAYIRILGLMEDDVPHVGANTMAKHGKHHALKDILRPKKQKQKALTNGSGPMGGMGENMAPLFVFEERINADLGNELPQAPGKPVSQVPQGYPGNMYPSAPQGTGSYGRPLQLRSTEEPTSEMGKINELLKDLHKTQKKMDEKMSSIIKKVEMIKESEEGRIEDVTEHDHAHEHEHEGEEHENQFAKRDSQLPIIEIVAESETSPEAQKVVNETEAAPEVKKIVAPTPKPKPHAVPHHKVALMQIIRQLALVTMMEVKVDEIFHQIDKEASSGVEIHRGEHHHYSNAILDAIAQRIEARRKREFVEKTLEYLDNLEDDDDAILDHIREQLLRGKNDMYLRRSPDGSTGGNDGSSSDSKSNGGENHHHKHHGAVHFLGSVGKGTGHILEAAFGAAAKKAAQDVEVVAEQAIKASNGHGNNAAQDTSGGSATGNGAN